MKNISETSTYTQVPFPLPCLSAVKCIYVNCRGPKEKISEVQKEIKHSYAKLKAVCESCTNASLHFFAAQTESP